MAYKIKARDIRKGDLVALGHSTQEIWFEVTYRNGETVWVKDPESPSHELQFNVASIAQLASHTDG